MRSCRFVRIWRGVLLGLGFSLLLAACESPEERAEKHYERGQSLVEDNLPEKAVLEFRSALAQNDRHVPTHFALGQLYESNGNLGAAFQQYRHVVDLESTHIDARLKTARFYLISNDVENAGVEIPALLKLDPVRADVQALRAKLALMQGEFETARSAIDEALAIDPANIEALANDVAYVLERQDARAALRRLDDVLAQHTESFPLHRLKLRLLELLEDQEGIGEQLGIMIEAFPDTLELRQTRARWALVNDDLDLARIDLEYLANAQPDEARAIVDLVRLARGQDGREAARALLSSFIQRAEDPGPLTLLRVRFDLETDRRDLAMTGLRELIATGGDETNTARLILARLFTASSGEDAAETAKAEALIDEILVQDATHTGALAFRAGRMIAADRLDEGIQQVRIGLNGDPDNVRLLLLAGQAQELLGNLDLANDRMAKAVRNDEYKPRTSRPYVQFLLRADRLKAAEIVLSETARRYPDDRDIIDMLGFTRVRLNNWFGAEQAAKTLDQLDPERAQQLRAAVLIEQERFEDGADLLVSLPTDKRQREASIAAAVQAYLRAGKIDDAHAFLDKLLSQNPADIQALGIRGNLYLMVEKYEDAERFYREVLRLDPANGNAFSSLSRLAQRRGDQKAATALLDEGLAVAPNDIGLMSRRAGKYEAENGFEQAIELYEKVYKRAPNLLMIANNLASLLADHAAEDPDALSRAYAIASRLKQSEVPQFRDTYGWTRHLQGEHDEALEYIEPLTEALPENPWIWFHLGSIYAALDRPNDARVAFEAALKKGGMAFARADLINAQLAALASN